ncbi:MAG: 50S ribosomal protein L18 [Candidatus Woesearchaeota archaeon]
MAYSAKYVVPYRRKREGRTNYRKRLELLKSRSIRLVIRKTNTSIIVQLAKYEPNGDRILYSITSKALSEYGWNHSYKCIPAAYLTGILISKKIKELKIDSIIPDFGLYVSTKGNRLYAVLKGLIDAGVEINVDEEMLPTENRIYGEHIDDSIKKDVEKIKSQILNK